MLSSSVGTTLLVSQMRPPTPVPAAVARSIATQTDTALAQRTASATINGVPCLNLGNIDVVLDQAHTCLLPSDSQFETEMKAGRTRCTGIFDDTARRAQSSENERFREAS
jgi:hypothetical protein